MANDFGNYQLEWYANEALIQLEQALGFGARVHRGYEPTPQQKGDVIKIRRPGTFTAQNAPSTAQDVDAEGLSITLDQWKEVKFALSDKELHATANEVIEDHIRPAAFALADDIDAKLAALYKKVPWFFDVNTSTFIKNITRAKQVLRKNGVPLEPGRIHMAVDDEMEASFLEQTFMHSVDVAGGRADSPLVNGTLARRMGVDFFPNGNVQQHTGGTVVTAGTDNVGAVNGAHAKGATTLAVNALSGSETLKAGDSFVIAGNTQRYVLTADATLSTGAASLAIYPGLAAALAGSEVVTFEAGASTNAGAYHANLLFHRNFAALATAPIEGELGSQMARRQGIEVFTVDRPDSGIMLRARRWYDPDNSKVVVALDILYGYGILDGNMAVNVRRDV